MKGKTASPKVRTRTAAPKKGARVKAGPVRLVAKDLVDGAPKPVKEKVSKQEAATIKTKLSEVGATVEIK